MCIQGFADLQVLSMKLLNIKFGPQFCAFWVCNRNLIGTYFWLPAAISVRLVLQSSFHLNFDAKRRPAVASEGYATNLVCVAYFPVISIELVFS